MPGRWMSDIYCSRKLDCTFFFLFLDWMAEVPIYFLDDINMDERTDTRETEGQINHRMYEMKFVQSYVLRLFFKGKNVLCLFLSVGQVSVR